jgi:hypothetical protein
MKREIKVKTNEKISFTFSIQLPEWQMCLHQTS